MKYVVCLMLVALILPTARSAGAESADNADDACFVSLSRVAEESAHPFVVSVYALFNDKLPWRNMKYLDSYIIPGENKYKIPAKLQKSDIHPSCLENIDYAVVKRNVNTDDVTKNGLDQARPVSVIKYSNRYYLSMFDWSYLTFDDIGDIVSINVVVFDIKNRTRNFVANASTWISVEGSNTIVDASVAGNSIKIIKSFYYPESTADGDIIAGNDGKISKYIQGHEPGAVGVYEINTQGILVEKLKFDLPGLFQTRTDPEARVH
jgi:hypothetical protein